MPESSIEFMSNRQYNPGAFGPFDVDVDDDITHVRVWIDRSTWDEDHPDPLISVQFWRREDGGEWLDGGSSSAHGGEIPSDDGVGEPITETDWDWSLPSAVNRELRAIITIHRRARLQATVDFIIR